MGAAGQNYGARKPDRVRETFRVSAVASSVLMLAMTALCQWGGASMMRFFTPDPEVIGFEDAASLTGRHPRDKYLASYSEIARESRRDHG